VSDTNETPIPLARTLSLASKDIAAAADSMFLLVFVLVCATVIRLRQRWPDQPRPFRVALAPAVPTLGMLAGLLLSAGLLHVSPIAWLTAGSWMLVGITLHKLRANSAPTQADLANIHKD